MGWLYSLIVRVLPLMKSPNIHPVSLLQLSRCEHTENAGDIQRGGLSVFVHIGVNTLRMQVIYNGVVKQVAVGTGVNTLRMQVIYNREMLGKDDLIGVNTLRMQVIYNNGFTFAKIRCEHTENVSGKQLAYREVWLVERCEQCRKVPVL